MTSIIFSKINDLSIQKKLLLSYIVVVFIPVLIVGIVLTKNITKMSVDSAIKESSNSIERIDSRLHEAMRVAEDITCRTKIDSNIERILVKNYLNILEYFEDYSTYKEFDKYKNYYKEIFDIKLYTSNNSIQNSGQFLIDTEIKENDWYMKSIIYDKNMFWDNIKTNGGKYYLSLISQIRGVQSDNYLGVLVVNLNPLFIESLLKDERYDSFIIDENATLISSNSINIGGIEKNREYDFLFLKNIKNEEIIKYNNSEMKCIIKKINFPVNNKELKIISLIPLEEIEDKVSRETKIGLVLIIGSLLIASIVVILFSYLISSRIKKLSNDMHRITEGDLKFVPQIVGNDEIGKLSKDMGIMLKSLNQLISEVYLANMQKSQLIIKQREIKLKMLANQINPHFLFNVLETIRMKAICNNEFEIAEVVKRLAKIMRRNLEIKNDFILVSEELELIVAYLEIQKFRFADRINYQINVDVKHKGYKILPMIIQPIVENAVIHGLESKGEKGIIKINFKEIDEILIIEVEDNGNGISNEKLETLIESLEDNEENEGRIGLKNIHQRIQLQYGNKFGLKISSELSSGTCVKIILLKEI